MHVFLFRTVAPGRADGISVHSGRLLSCTADRVQCLSPEGVLMRKLLVPEEVSNLCHGERDKHVRHFTNTTSLYYQR